jgi:GWxTD domain-containing protein
MLAGLVHTPIARALSWALIHFLWEGAAIAALLAAALFVFRPASARVRYGLACVALCAMLAAPAATLGILWPRIQADAGVVVRSGALPADRAPAPAPGPPPALPLDRLGWVAPLWMAGVLLFYLRTAASWAAAERLRRRGTIPASAGWQDRLRALARRLRISRPVLMLESCLAETPAVVGYLRPAILIPAGLLTGLAPEQVEAILLHELAHIRRHDYAVNVLQTLVEGLLFYHPAVWWVSGLIRAERENCCDDAVVAVVGDARGYAAALAELEWRRSVGKPALAAKGGNLVQRIHRLLEPEGPRSIAGPVLGATLLVVSIAAALMAWQPPAPALAQSSERATQEAQPRVQLDTPYEKWLAEDVVYIITPEEKAAFQRLQTNQEREQFIEQFWLKRDPTPGTFENEFKEEHYRRIAYANEHFAERIPGWKTHRGMYYIRFGPPDEIDDHTAARPPFVAWTYRAIQPAPGVPASEATVVFTDVDGSGQFILPRHTPSGAVIMGTPPSPPRVEVLSQTATVAFNIPSFGGPTVVYIRIENQAGANVGVIQEEANAPRYTKSFQLTPGVYHIQVFVQRPGEGAIALYPRGQEFEIPGPGAALR